MQRKEVIVDTNALFIAEEFGVDIFYELERLGYDAIIVPRVVLDELNKLRLEQGLKGKEKIAANIALSLLLKYASLQAQGSLLGRCKVKIDEEGNKKVWNIDTDTDEVIVELALKKKAAVLTNDEKLRSKLSKLKITTLYLRGGNRLEEKK